MKLTRETIDRLSLPAGKSDVVFWDDDLPGFGLRIRTGSRKFIYYYRSRKTQRRISLGPATKDTVDFARKSAGELAIQIKQGVDPGMNEGLRKILKVRHPTKLDHIASIWNGILAAAGKPPLIPLDAADVANLIEGLRIAQRYAA